MDGPLIDPPDEFARVPTEGLLVLHLWLSHVNELIRRSGIGARLAYEVLHPADEAGRSWKQRKVRGVSPGFIRTRTAAAAQQRRLCFAVTDGQVRV